MADRYSRVVRDSAAQSGVNLDVAGKSMSALGGARLMTASTGNGGRVKGASAEASARPTSYTPAVRALASTHGVDLDALVGSGVGGRVTVDDVRRAAGPAAQTPTTSRASVARAARPTGSITIHSLFGGRARVTIDPWATNPLADDYRQANPEVFGIATREQGDPPKMFTGGTADLPAFTAAGIDPRDLLRIPYTARHYAAGLSGQAAMEFFEDYSSDPYASFAHHGFGEAIDRLRRWAMGQSWR